jgi:hypothetical protein
MSNIDFYVVAEAVGPNHGVKKQNRIRTRQPLIPQAKPKTEMEARLWKSSSEACSEHLNGFEFTAFLLFGVLALGTLAYCSYELFQLLNNSALDGTVRALLTR